ncbi:MAG: hypothetical protein ACRC8W_12470 [Plesiomonas shigelloides]
MSNNQIKKRSAQKFNEARDAREKELRDSAIKNGMRSKASLSSKAKMVAVIGMAMTGCHMIGVDRLDSK